MAYVIAALIVAVVFALGARVGRDQYRRQLLGIVRGTWLELSRHQTKLGVPDSYLDGAKQALDHVRTHLDGD